MPWSPSELGTGTEVAGGPTLLVRKLSKLLSKALRTDDAGGVPILVFCCMPTFVDGVPNFVKG